jgi:hypothetical protein
MILTKLLQARKDLLTTNCELRARTDRLYLPQSLALRERAAAGLGNEPLAASYRNRLAALKGG